MNEKIKALFVRVVSRKMKKENKTADEVLAIYPKLSDEDKVEIKQTLQDK